MRILSISIGLAALLAIAPRAGADCSCPKISLDERITGAIYIFTGKPVVSAQVPGGESPFHSEMTLEEPHSGAPNDLVTLFRIETVWKGEARRTVKVRSNRGECAAEFKPNISTIIFAEADKFGALWTRGCSGDAQLGDEDYEGLKTALTNHLRFN